VLSSFNAIFGKIGRIASEDVIVRLINAKCMPNVYVCIIIRRRILSVEKSQTESLQFAVNSCFMKLFKTKMMQDYCAGIACMDAFGCFLPPLLQKGTENCCIRLSQKKSLDLDQFISIWLNVKLSA